MRDFKDLKPIFSSYMYIQAPLLPINLNLYNVFPINTSNTPYVTVNESGGLVACYFGAIKEASLVERKADLFWMLAIGEECPGRVDLLHRPTPPTLWQSMGKSF